MARHTSTRNKKRPLTVNAPIFHQDHARPRSRRDFIAQGLRAGTGIAMGFSAFSLFSTPRAVQAALSSDLEALKSECGLAVQGAGKIPFICFDLAGGANIAGSNVLVGGAGGQLDFLSTAGYSKLGLPGDMIPPIANPQ
ncbi:MAG: general secretion pathway protein GspF, partial [Gammaproteobacteria bacterium]